MLGLRIFAGGFAADVVSGAGGAVDGPEAADGDCRDEADDDASFDELLLRLVCAMLICGASM